MYVLRRLEKEENPMTDEKRWRCFHCGTVFTDYEEARKHFGNIPSATPQCILKKCLCLDCPCNLIECSGRREWQPKEVKGEKDI